MSLARFALCASLVALFSIANTQNPLWSTYIHVPESSYDAATKFVQAPDGSFFACGNDFGGAMVVHYSSTGQLLWQQALPGKAMDLAVNGNSVAVGGEVIRSASVTGADGGAQADPFAARIDYSGNVIFQTVYPVAGNDAEPTRIGMDTTGNVVLASSRNNNLWMFRYSPTGALVWTKSFLTSTTPTLGDMFMDANGCVLVGSEQSGATIGAFVARVDNSAQTSWIKNYVSNFRASIVAGDNSGNSFVGVYGGAGVAQLVKLDANGTQLWAANLPNMGQFTGIAFAPDGSINVSGHDLSVNHYLSYGRVTSLGVVVFNNIDSNYFLTGDSSDNVAVDGAGNIYCGVDFPGIRQTEGIVKYSPTGVFNWARPISGNSTVPKANDFNVGVVMGVGGGPVGFGSLIMDTTLIDFAIAGYDSAGNPLFQTLSDCKEAAHLTLTSATDSAGNTYIAGAVRTLNSLVTLQKLNANGSVQWSKKLPMGSGTHAQSWGVQLTSNMVLVLASWLASPNDAGLKVFAYDSAGNLLWTSPNVPSNPSFFSSDANGNSYTMATDGSNLFITKISNTGSILWSTPLSPSNYGAIGKIVVDSLGQVYVSATDTGIAKLSSSGVVLWQFPYDGQAFLNSSGELFAYNATSVTKYDTSGVVLWSTPLLPSDGVSALFAGMTDAAGNIFVAGQLGSPSTDIYVAKLSPAGGAVWSRTYDLSSKDYGVGLVPDGHGGVVVNGISSTNQNSWDVLTIKYDLNGNLIWPASGGVFRNGAALIRNRWFTDDWPSNIGGYASPLAIFADQPNSIAIDGTGNVYVTDRTTSPLGESSFNVVKYDGLMAPDNALFVSQTVPSSMTAGQTYTVTVYMKNTGTATWTAAGGYLLSGLNGNTWSRATVLLSNTDSIAPGATKKFSFSVFAPTTAGTYPMQWRMSHNGAQFGMATALVNVPVSVRQNAARYLSQTVPTSVKAGSTFSVTVKMRNVGTTTWTLAAGQKLASTSPDMNTTWGTVTVPMGGADAIAQGQDKTFTFNCTAPLTPGSYTMRWRMYRSAAAFTGFFGDITSSRTITVTP